MTLIVPSSINFKMRFSAFAATSDADIEFAIEEAKLACAEGEWIDDANQTWGIMLYAAHVLQLAVLRGGSGTGQIIASERIGEMSLTYSVPDPSKPIDFTMTVYGTKFLELVKKNFPAVLTVGSATAM